MFFRALVLFAALFTQVSHADINLYRQFPVLNCPAVTDDYATLISKLDAIKTSVKSDANCSAVSLQVDNLEKLLNNDRAKVLAIVDNANGQPLSPADAQSVRDYTQNLTEYVTGLNDLFLQSNQCFSEDKSSTQLSALGGLVNEATTLLGMVAGPWGAPIAIGGKIVAGFLSGLQQVLKSRSGYDFTQREQWMSYVQNLCTYESYRPQIDHLLNPTAHVQKLLDFKTKLDEQLAAMAASCDECRTIVTAYGDQHPVYSAMITTSLQKMVSDADFKSGVPYGTYTLQDLGLRDWIASEIARVQDDVQSEWGNVSGQYLLTRAQEQIRDFLITRTAPQFLRAQGTQSQGDLNNFQSLLTGQGRSLYDSLNKIAPTPLVRPLTDPSWTTPLDFFSTLVAPVVTWQTSDKDNANDDLKYAWLSFQDQSIAQLRTAETSTNVALSFCSFFKHAGQYIQEIREQCNSVQLQKLNDLEVQYQGALITARPDNEGQARALLSIPNIFPDKPYVLSTLDSLIQTVEARTIKR